MSGFQSLKISVGFTDVRFKVHSSKFNKAGHGLRTPNEGINQRNLKNWADVADKIMLRPYLKIWDWDLIYGRAVKAISSLGVRSRWHHPNICL